MGELTEAIKNTDLVNKIEAGELKIVEIGEYEFLTTKQAVPFLESCKIQAETKAKWIAERQKNFTKSGKPRKRILLSMRPRPLNQ